MTTIGKSAALMAIAAMAASVSGSGETFASIGIPKGHTPNKYRPHQGAKEKARRSKRLARAEKGQ